MKALLHVINLFLFFILSLSLKNGPHFRLRNKISMHSKSNSDEADVIIIGSGIAGLSCGAILASRGRNVIVCESHYEIGGCAHEFYYTEAGQVIPSDKLSPDDAVYCFEAGPSLYSHVFQMINEEPEWITYDIWGAFLPEAPNGFKLSIGAAAFLQVLQQYGGPTAVSDWNKIAAAMRPIADGVMNLPTVAIRPDPGILLTLVLRYSGALFKTVRQGSTIVKPFSAVLKELDIQDVFLKNYLNLLCFLLQGLPAEGTLSAVMAYMVEDLYRPGAVMDFPKGGSAAIASALERGITKNGGKVLRRSHVERVLVEDGRAVGVELRGGRRLSAREAVVSNCDLWTTYKLLPREVSEALDAERTKLEADTPLCSSFMHLHLGIDAADLPADLPPQWTVCQDWSQPIDAPGNVIVVSVPSLLDPDLAPPGRHVIHAYTAGNEPYELWEKFNVKNIDNREELKAEYERLKEDRAACLWEAVEKNIPDVRRRAKVTLVGTPLTHERFNRRYRGTYGPAIAAGQSQVAFPGQTTPLPGFYRCGDSTNPGIGVPAVAASGAMAAAAILPVWDHLKLLDRIRF